MTAINKYLKKLLLFTLIVLTAFSVSACKKAGDNKISDDTATKDEITPTATESASTEPVPAYAKYTVGVILCGDSEDYTAAYEGFVKAFDERDVEQSGVHHNIILTKCSDKKECAAAASDFVSQEVDLIYAIGSTAAKAAAKATDTIPIIFSCVADPIEAGLLSSCVAPDKNITGVSDFTPAEEQIRFLRDVLPGVKKIGAVYCATDANSTLVSTLAQNEAENWGLEYNTYAASNEEQLKISVENALEKSDALYLCEDELTVEQSKLIFDEANKKKIPVISATDAFMTKGALMTSLPDYTDLGYNAGELALICLKGIKPINEISVEYPTLCLDYVSKSAMKRLSAELSDTASEINIEYID